MAETRVAIVTGAGRGIGRAIAARLAQDGYAVAVADIDEGAAGRVAGELASASGLESFAVPVDVADPDSAQALAARVLERAGRIDTLVNNAAIVGPSVPTAEYPLEAWRQVLAVGLDGVFYCTRAVLPHMIARGSGRIVNIASIAGKEGNPQMPAYSAAKAGVIGLTKALGRELAGTGIVVNAIAPAMIDTEMARSIPEETRRALIGKIPVGRLGRPEEIAALVAWLCSPECSFSTGAVYDISGGRATY